MNRKSDDKKQRVQKSVINYGVPFDYMLEGCQIISRDYRYLYVNDVVAKQGKLSRKAMLGKTMMACYPGIEKTKMFGFLHSCIENGTPHNMENEFRFPDGTTGWFELHMEPLPEGAIILSVDISEHKRSEEHTKRLEELKTTFMMIVSHQLRTPLSVVRGSLESMRGLDGLHDEATREDMIEAAHAATLEIVSRVDEVLEALAAEADKHTLNKEPSSFEALWLPIYAVFKKQAGAKGINFVYTPPSTPLPLIIADATRLKRILESLAENAVLYTPGGGSITADITRSDTTIRFSIHDNGIGIPKNEQSRVFNRFFRGSNAINATPDATGLSLAVAKYYVQKHGGKIGFSSTKHSGTTFWFELPIS
jgi:PAS domain S-box-containing protein